MRFVRRLCLMASVLVVDVHCGSPGSSAGDGGVTCTGQQAVCPGQPYAVCVEVQQSLGRCLDWTMLGASPCSTGPVDCQATLPAASFPATPEMSRAGAICVQATDIRFSTGPASPGYCAAIQTYTDVSGAATCTPNPCGATGYCSYLHTAAGSVVSCLWPI
jgi:hypothetical protein